MMTVDVGQAAELALQHLVGPEPVVELDQGDVGDHAGEVDGRLDAGVAAADDGDALALEERAVAVRAVGDALVAVLVLAGHVHRAPAGAGGQHDGAASAAMAPLASSTVTRPPLAGGHEAGGPLQVHDVDVVLLDVLLERGGELGALGVGHRDEVLDGHGVEHLAAEALGWRRRCGCPCGRRRSRRRRRRGRRRRRARRRGPSRRWPRPGARRRRSSSLATICSRLMRP